ncbi:hypothetical protein DFH11DRAFT_1691715 [Phellopilus nigrolimitatus]|nr:hypothetical protein DFH11DRAFT_1691715 [Phellopilus nigrolimitatus]
MSSAPAAPPLQLYPRASAAAASPDKVHAKFRTFTYPHYAVYLVSALIGAVALWHLAERALAFAALRRARRARSRPPPSDADDAREKGADADREAAGGARTERVDLRRAPRALLAAARVVAYRVTLPVAPGTRLPLVEVLIPLGYLAALLTLEFARARSVATGALSPSYWANRAGVLAVSQLTFVVALAGKNNIVSALTGIGYEKLNILHRAASRTIVLLIWVHLWGRDAPDSWFIEVGIVGASALTLAALLGAKQLRDRAYDVFVAVHVVLVLCVPFRAAPPPYKPYVWPPFLVWGLDRALRAARVLRLRLLAARTASSGAGTHATLEVLSPDTLRVTLRTRGGALALTWRAGQSAYLTAPAAARSPLAAHPFTIASVDAALPSSPHGGGGAEGGEERELRFIVRARRGFTRRLHALAARAPGGVCATSVYVDGPYGAPPDVHAYPRVLLVAGGSGVSFTLPLLLDVARRARDEAPTTRTRRVLFVWFVRERGKCCRHYTSPPLRTILTQNLEHTEWIARDLAALEARMPGGLDVAVRIFVTGTATGTGTGTPAAVDALPTLAETGADAGVSAGSSKERLESPVSPVSEAPSAEDEKAVRTSAAQRNTAMVRVARGRPGVAGLLEEELAGAGAGAGGDACVSVSGPQALIDDVRGALRGPRAGGPGAVLRGGAGVFLHVEHFGM